MGLRIKNSPEFVGEAVVKRGVVLFETMWLLVLFSGLLVWGHIKLVREYNHKLKELQLKRKPYDGIKVWRQ